MDDDSVSVTPRLASCCPPLCWASSSDPSPSSCWQLHQRNAVVMPARCQRCGGRVTPVTLVLESFIIADVRASLQCIGVSLSKGAQWGRYENKDLRNISGCPPTPQPPPPWNIQTCSNVLCKRRVKKKNGKWGQDWTDFLLIFFFCSLEKYELKVAYFFLNQT